MRAARANPTQKTVCPPVSILKKISCHPTNRRVDTATIKRVLSLSEKITPVAVIMRKTRFWRPQKARSRPHPHRQIVCNANANAHRQHFDARCFVSQHFRALFKTQNAKLDPEFNENLIANLRHLSD